MLKKIVSWMLCVVLVLECCGSFAEDSAAVASVSSGIRYEGPGFDTAEEAVLCYMEGLRDLDFEKMLSAYAWETMISHFSVEAHLNRLGSYSQTTYPRFPALNDFMVTADMHLVRANEIRYICNAIESYILGEEGPNGFQIPQIPFQEEGDVEAYLQKFDNGKLEKLSGMTNIRFLTPDIVTDGMSSLEKNQQYFARRAAPYCADEVVDVVAVGDVEDGMIVCAPLVARYGEKWYIVSCCGNVPLILGIDTNHMALWFTENPEDLIP